MLGLGVTAARVALGYMITRLLAAFGLGAISYASIQAALTFVEDEIKILVSSNFPTLALEMLGIMRFDLCLNLIFSSLAGVVAFKSLVFVLGRA